MDASVLDLKNQVPDIIHALERNKKVIVSYGNNKFAVLQPIPEGMMGPEEIRDDPAFGIWRDRDDLADPAEFVRNLRKGRGHAL